MEIRPDIVKQQRQHKGWTQQHLADACDVSLRTIQRVEKVGNASHETIMSLCAVFEIDIEELKAVPKAGNEILETVNLGGQMIALIIATIVGSIAGASLMYWWMV